MSKLKPKLSNNSLYWRSRYYPYYWWRRRYYPDYWWHRRWYAQPGSTEPQPSLQGQSSAAESSNPAMALQQAFCMRVDVMFMVKALKHARDQQLTDEQIYDLVDKMLEMYHMEWEMLDVDDFDELISSDSTTSESETEAQLPPPPMPEPSPAPTAGVSCPAPMPTPEPEPAPEQSQPTA